MNNIDWMNGIISEDTFCYMNYKLTHYYSYHEHGDSKYPIRIYFFSMDGHLGKINLIISSAWSHRGCLFLRRKLKACKQIPPFQPRYCCDGVDGCSTWVGVVGHFHHTQIWAQLEILQISFSKWKSLEKLLNSKKQFRSESDFLAWGGWWRLWWGAARRWWNQLWGRRPCPSRWWGRWLGLGRASR